MGTPHWVSMFEEPQRYSDPTLTPETRLSSIQESRCGEWVQEVRRISKESLMSRPLPDIPKQSPKNHRSRKLSPVPSFENKCYNVNSKEIHTKSADDTKNKRRKSKRQDNISPIRQDKKKIEKSVSLTLSPRSGRKSHKQRDLYIGVNNIDNSEITSTVLHKKSGTLESSCSRKESENSRTELVKTLPRKKRRRNVCIIPMVIMTVLIMGGLFTAIAVIFLRPLDESERKENGYKMVVASVQLRLLNQTFVKDMRNRNSKKYAEIKRPLCHEMDGVFLLSDYSGHYYGCDVLLLRSGSIRVLQELLFRETDELRKPKSIQSLIAASSPSFDWKGLKVINMGDFIVDYDSIKVKVDLKEFTALPRKPFSSSNGIPHEDMVTTTSLTTSTKRVIKNLWRWGRTTIPTTTTRKSAAKPTTMTPSVNRGKVDRTTLQPLPRSQTTKSNVHVRLETGVTTSVASSEPITSSISSAKNVVEVSSATPATEMSTASSLVEGSSTTANVKSTSGGPAISMTNSNEPIAGGSVVVECTHQNLPHWTYLIITHIRKGFGNTKVLNVSADGNADPPDRKYTDRLVVKVKLSDTSASVSLNFTSLNCADEGSYTCMVHSPDQTLSKSGYLYVRANPSKPELTVPIETVEQQEITEPITCTANVGYPVGTLMWFVKPKGHTKFLPLDVSKVEYTGECKNIATSIFKLVPSLEGNGTIIKCSVINPHFSETEELTSTAVWKVIPVSICHGKPDNYMMRHPYQCDRYIRCTKNTVHVFECPNTLCFNTETKTCGHTGLVMNDVIAYMNEGVTSLTCRLQHTGSWNSISFWKVLPSGAKQRIVKIYNNANRTDVDDDMRSRVFADVQKTKYEANVKLWIYVLVCQDAGTYVCSAETDFIVKDTQANLKLKVKPKPPKISSPAEIIEGRSMRRKFVCQGEVGFPYGSLRWEVKYKGQSEFSRLSSSVYNDTEKGTVIANCSKIVRRELIFLPSKTQDEMVIRCVVDNNETLPSGEILWDSVQVHVISANYCHSQNSTYLTHPHDCRQYIQCSRDYVYVQRCSIGLCFNPDTEQCDIPEPTDSYVFDPDFPCRPNKNGVYYPHPFLCNKYIWCVQGKDILQHCPLGTLYLSDGQCTFNTKQSRCYKRSED